MLMFIKRGRVVTYYKKVPPIFLHDTSIKWSCEVNWQIKYVTALLALDQ